MRNAEVLLTRSEFELLVLLASSPGVVLSREDLFKTVWGTHWVGDGHAVEVQISRLRQKLGDNGDGPRLITTVRSAAIASTAKFSTTSSHSSTTHTSV